ncbi:MAG: hypothetical protein ACOY45_12300 [Pseudomonadota bacterium]
MTQNDLDYYRLRAREERRRAEAQGDCAARRVHAELAERYSRMVRERDQPSMPLPIA